jgi:hypothetical protein
MRKLLPGRVVPQMAIKPLGPELGPVLGTEPGTDLGTHLETLGPELETHLGTWGSDPGAEAVKARAAGASNVAAR